MTEKEAVFKRTEELFDEEHSNYCLSVAKETSKDIKLLSRDGEEFVVPAVLAFQVSSLLETLFTSKHNRWKETSENLLITPFPSKILQLTTDYILTGRTKCSNDTVLPLINAAKYFNLTTLFELAWKWVVFRLTPSNAVIVHEAARAFNYLPALKQSWKMLGIFDLQALLFENEVFCSIGWNAITHILQHRKHLKLPSEDYLLSRLFYYFDQNKTLPKVKLYRAILNTSIINFQAVSTAFWHGLSEEHERFVDLALGLREATKSIASDRDVKSVTFNGTWFKCNTCNSTAFMSLEVSNRLCCEHCWKTHVQPYVVNLYTFTFKKSRRTTKRKALPRQDSRSQVDLSRKGTFISLTSSEKRQRISSEFSQKMEIGSKISVEQDESSIIFCMKHPNYSRNYTDFNYLVQQPFDEKSQLLQASLVSGRYVLKEFFDFMWENTILDIQVSPNFNVIASATDSRGTFRLEGSCLDSHFKLFKKYKNTQFVLTLDRTFGSRITGTSSELVQNNMFAALSQKVRGYFELERTDKCEETVVISDTTLVETLKTEDRNVVVDTRDENFQIAELGFGNKTKTRCLFMHELSFFDSYDDLKNDQNIGKKAEVFKLSGCFNCSNRSLKGKRAVCLECLAYDYVFMACDKCLTSNVPSTPRCLHGAPLRNLTAQSILKRSRSLQRMGFLLCTVCTQEIDLKKQKVVKACECNTDVKAYFCQSCAILPKLRARGKNDRILTGYCQPQALVLFSTDTTRSDKLVLTAVQKNSYCFLQYTTKGLNVMESWSLNALNNKGIKTPLFQAPTKPLVSLKREKQEQTKMIDITVGNIMDIWKYAVSHDKLYLVSLCEDYFINNFIEIMSLFQKQTSETQLTYFILDLFMISSVSTRYILSHTLKNNKAKKHIIADLQQFAAAVAEFVLQDMEKYLSVLAVYLCCLFSGIEDSLLWLCLDTVSQQLLLDTILELFINKAYHLNEGSLHKLGRLVASIITVLGNKGWKTMIQTIIVPKICSIRQMKLSLVLFSSLAYSTMKEYRLWKPLFFTVSDFMIVQAHFVGQIEFLHPVSKELASKVHNTFTGNHNVYASQMNLPYYKKDLLLARRAVEVFGVKLAKSSFKKENLKILSASFSAICVIVLYFSADKRDTDNKVFHSFAKVGTHLLKMHSIDKALTRVVVESLLPTLILLVLNSRFLYSYFNTLGDVFRTLLLQCSSRNLLPSTKLYQYYQYLLSSIQELLAIESFTAKQLSSVFSWSKVFSSFLQEAEPSVYMKNEWFLSHLSNNSIEESSIVYLLSSYGSMFVNVGEVWEPPQMFSDKVIQYAKAQTKYLDREFFRGRIKRRKDTVVVFDINPEVPPKHNDKHAVEAEIDFISSMTVKNPSFCLLMEKSMLPLMVFLEDPIRNFSMENCMRLYMLAGVLKYSTLEDLGIVFNDKVSELMIYFFMKLLRLLETIESDMLFKAIVSSVIAILLRFEKDATQMDSLYVEHMKLLELATEQLLNRLVMLANKDSFPKYTDRQRITQFCLICDTLESTLSAISSQSLIIHYFTIAEQILSSFLVQLRETKGDEVLTELIGIFYDDFQYTLNNFTLDLTLSLSQHLEDTLVETLIHLLHSAIEYDTSLLLFETVEFLSYLAKLIPTKVIRKKHMFFDTLLTLMLEADLKVKLAATSLLHNCLVESSRIGLTFEEMRRLFINVFLLVREKNRGLDSELSYIRLVVAIVNQRPLILTTNEVYLQELTVYLRELFSRKELYLRSKLDNEGFVMSYHEALLCLLDSCVDKLAKDELKWVLDYLFDMAKDCFPRQKEARQTEGRSILSRKSSITSHATSIISSVSHHEHSVTKLCQKIITKLRKANVHGPTLTQLEELLPLDAKPQQTNNNVFAKVFGF